MTKKTRLSRRDFLRLSALTAAGAALASCSPATPTEAPTQAPPTEAPPGATPEPTIAPTAPPVEGTVVVMHARNELTEDEEAQFEADNPGIQIEFIQYDDSRLNAMIAAQVPPDMWRVGGSGGAVPGWILRNLLLDLTPYLEVSDKIRLDDLAPANYYYFAQDALHIGSGKAYGMVKDWSPGMTLFVNTDHFQAAGIEVPSEAEPLDYQAIGEMARQLTQTEGDRTLVWGFGGDPVDWNVELDAWNHVAETAGSEPNPYVNVLYNDIYTQINLTTNEAIKAAFKYYYDLEADSAMSSPVNPSSNWSGQDFADGKIAIAMEGYWFGGMAETDATRGKVKMLPSARWSPDGRRLDWCTATGAVTSATTRVPDATWRVFEWYNAGEPAIARATSGWGVPALLSMYSLMPQDTEFNQQRYNVLLYELENVETNHAMPRSPWGGSFWLQTIWNKHTEPALRGQSTYDEALVNIEAEVNDILERAFARYS